MDISEFDKVWEIEYISDRVKRIREDVKAGRYESAMNYLQMIQDKAKAAAYLVSQQKANNSG